MSERVLCGERVIPIPTRNTAKIARRGKASSGRDKSKKGPNCKTSPIKKFYLCNPKAVRRSDYEVMVKKFIAKANG